MSSLLSQPSPSSPATSAEEEQQYIQKKVHTWCSASYVYMYVRARTSVVTFLSRFFVTKHSLILIVLELYVIFKYNVT